MTVPGLPQSRAKGHVPTKLIANVSFSFFLSPYSFFFSWVASSLSFYCICYNPTALGDYNTQSKATED